MKPVTFACTETLALAPQQIAEQILEIGNWTDFNGYGPLPGIERAEFELRTPEIIGSRIRVENMDGSSHIEEIMTWDPARLLKLYMHEFSKPLSLLATRFEETWEFEMNGDTTRVVRSFALYPRSALTRPVLCLISLFLKRAIARHLQRMRETNNQQD